MLLVSGLQVGGKHDPLLVSLLVDFVAGYLGGAEDQKGTSARYGKGKSLFGPGFSAPTKCSVVGFTAEETQGTPVHHF